jgi:uncharacterized protein YbjT (DUF2867 family)
LVPARPPPVAIEDEARAIAAVLANPQPHIGKIYHLTGPQSARMQFYAEAYLQALGRKIAYRDIPVEQWREGLLQPRYHRMSNDVLTLTGQSPIIVCDFGRSNASAFTV